MSFRPSHITYIIPHSFVASRSTQASTALSSTQPSSTTHSNAWNTGTLLSTIYSHHLWTAFRCVLPWICIISPPHESRPAGRLRRSPLVLQKTGRPRRRIRTQQRPTVRPHRYSPIRTSIDQTRIADNMLDHELVDSTHSTLTDYRCIDCRCIPPSLSSHYPNHCLVSARVTIRVFNENASNDSLPFIRHTDQTIFQRWSARMRLTQDPNGIEIAEHIRLIVSHSIIIQLSSPFTGLLSVLQ